MAWSSPLPQNDSQPTPRSTAATIFLTATFFTSSQGFSSCLRAPLPVVLHEDQIPKALVMRPERLLEGKRHAHLVYSVEQRGKEVSVVGGVSALQHSYQPFQAHSRVHVPLGQGLQTSICLSGQGRCAR